jgi:hypothetical protein
MSRRLHTSVIFSEVDLFLQFQIVSIHLCIETVILFEDTCQGSYSSVDTAPMSYTFTGINLWHYVFEVLLPKRLNRSTLQSLDRTGFSGPIIYL